MKIAFTVRCITCHHYLLHWAGLAQLILTFNPYWHWLCKHMATLICPNNDVGHRGALPRCISTAVSLIPFSFRHNVPNVPCQLPWFFLRNVGHRTQAHYLPGLDEWSDKTATKIGQFWTRAKCSYKLDIIIDLLSCLHYAQNNNYWHSSSIDGLSQKSCSALLQHHFL